MSLFKNYENKPVLIQLKNPLCSVRSEKEVLLDDGALVGSPTICMIQDAEGKPAPQLQQLLLGEVLDEDDSHVMMSSLGGDLSTPCKILIEKSNISAVTFCSEHVEAEKKQAPSIVTP
jgi:hypothetical protein